MVLRGYELGTSESVAIVILIGLSVDYVVHLGNAYMESHCPTREARALDALRDMGVSVLAGALTTLGASQFLWPAEVIFFIKFGKIVLFSAWFEDVRVLMLVFCSFYHHFDCIFRIGLGSLLLHVLPFRFWTTRRNRQHYSADTKMC